MKITLFALIGLCLTVQILSIKRRVKKTSINWNFLKCFSATTTKKTTPKTQQVISSIKKAKEEEQKNPPVITQIVPADPTTMMELYKKFFKDIMNEWRNYKIKYKIFTKKSNKNSSEEDITELVERHMNGVRNDFILNISSKFAENDDDNKLRAVFNKEKYDRFVIKSKNILIEGVTTLESLAGYTDTCPVDFEQPKGCDSTFTPHGKYCGQYYKPIGWKVGVEEDIHCKDAKIKGCGDGKCKLFENVDATPHVNCCCAPVSDELYKVVLTDCKQGHYCNSIDKLAKPAGTFDLGRDKTDEDCLKHIPKCQDLTNGSCWYKEDSNCCCFIPLKNKYN
jgi:hypothetical protein